MLYQVYVWFNWFHEVFFVMGIFDVALEVFVQMF